MILTFHSYHPRTMVYCPVAYEQDLLAVTVWTRINVWNAALVTLTFNRCLQTMGYYLARHEKVCWPVCPLLCIHVRIHTDVTLQHHHTKLLRGDKNHPNSGYWKHDGYEMNKSPKHIDHHRRSPTAAWWCLLLITREKTRSKTDGDN